MTNKHAGLASFQRRRLSQRDCRRLADLARYSRIARETLYGMWGVPFRMKLETTLLHGILNSKLAPHEEDQFFQLLATEEQAGFLRLREQAAKIEKAPEEELLPLLTIDEQKKVGRLRKRLGERTKVSAEARRSIARALRSLRVHARTLDHKSEVFRRLCQQQTELRESGRELRTRLRSHKDRMQAVLRAARERILAPIKAQTQMVLLAGEREPARVWERGSLADYMAQKQAYALLVALVRGKITPDLAIGQVYARSMAERALPKAEPRTLAALLSADSRRTIRKRMNQSEWLPGTPLGEFLWDEPNRFLQIKASLQIPKSLNKQVELQEKRIARIAYLEGKQQLTAEEESELEERRKKLYLDEQFASLFESLARKLGAAMAGYEESTGYRYVGSMERFCVFCHKLPATLDLVVNRSGRPWWSQGTQRSWWSQGAYPWCRTCPLPLVHGEKISLPT
jgi:hypothetical protein